ncbi:hypothetical protein [Nocardia brasiliensis]|uniref:hypothetical protein n=1 Tax=Nocardia brasiliensis TaxID=37326 RepID=UPI002458B708|nr:hypothetical protein [Nocardia brasiliensis]
MGDDVVGQSRIRGLDSLGSCSAQDDSIAEDIDLAEPLIEAGQRYLVDFVVVADDNGRVVVRAGCTRGGNLCGIHEQGHEPAAVIDRGGGNVELCVAMRQGCVQRESASTDHRPFRLS